MIVSSDHGESFEDGIFSIVEEQNSYRYSMHIESNGKQTPIRAGIVAITDGHYKMIHSLTHNSVELFDLKIDPDESKISQARVFACGSDGHCTHDGIWF